MYINILINLTHLLIFFINVNIHINIFANHINNHKAYPALELQFSTFLSSVLYLYNIF